MRRLGILKGLKDRLGVFQVGLPSPPTRVFLAAPDPALAGLCQLEPVQSLAQARALLGPLLHPLASVSPMKCA